jgi:uncharacterized membrane protein YbaN (DUF454 family)
MNKFKKIALIVLGWIFLLVGIIGLFLPFLQGVLFIMIGLAILSSRSETIQRLLRHIEQRHPHHHERYVAWKERIKGWFDRRKR